MVLLERADGCDLVVLLLVARADQGDRLVGLGVAVIGYYAGEWVASALK